ncbi:preprotein translocase subunit SecG [Allorhodopirellula solitaria]|uniref:Protein-export membrane protein SecG n=1 Tax=Allorhodopirellula solitaria TaxID=2527987 RepID=A0A5C5X0I4_9BACT|nr:preprotein translocase subunit SecG [Allorhodopirellula solitaria]TWT56109.1 preprotein translocase subunit SecG [Allorhodopirellula solitaria]
MLHSIDLTPFLPLADFVSMVLGMLMAFLSLFLILLILLQRGRGGGLAGALGGAGGQSAFGSKAGDTFTVLTVSLAGIWIFVCAFAMWKLGPHLGTDQTAANESNVIAGPGDDQADDASNDLVIPTNENLESELGNGDLSPADEPVEDETPVEMETAVDASQDAELGEATSRADATTGVEATPDDAESETPETTSAD